MNEITKKAINYFEQVESGEVRKQDLELFLAKNIDDIEFSELRSSIPLQVLLEFRSGIKKVIDGAQYCMGGVGNLFSYEHQTRLENWWTSNNLSGWTDLSDKLK